LIRTTRNKIKNELKACRVAVRKLERERKRQVEALQKAKEFVPFHLLEAIPDPELSTTEADIDLQLRERLISTSAEIDLDLDSTLQETKTMGSNVNGEAGDCLFTSQADYMPLLGSGNRDIMDWDYLDTDEDADINLF
jgi:hypothetical protein